MITQRLEELICTGKAQNITFNCTGGASIFKMPPGKHAVLHSIRVAPFSDLNPGVDWNKIDNLSNRMMQQLTISSKLSTNSFLFRFSCIQSGFSDVTAQYMPFGQETVETYLTHETDIFFEWLHAPKISAWARTNSVIPGRANNPNRPIIGYGTDASGGVAGLVATARIDYNDATNSEVKNYSNFIAPASPNSFNEFKIPASNDTRQQPSDYNKVMSFYGFPIVTAQIVLIDGNNGIHFKGSN